MVLKGDGCKFVQAIHKASLDFLKEHKVPFMIFAKVILRKKKAEVQRFLQRTNWDMLDLEEQLLYAKLYKWLGKPVQDRLDKLKAGNNDTDQGTKFKARALKKQVLKTEQRKNLRGGTEEIESPKDGEDNIEEKEDNEEKGDNKEAEHKGEKEDVQEEEEIDEKENIAEKEHIAEIEETKKLEEKEEKASLENGSPSLGNDGKKSRGRRKLRPRPSCKEGAHLIFVNFATPPYYLDL